MLNELQELQKWLKVPIAGVAVRTAIQAYQKTHGLQITGTPTFELWEHLAKGKTSDIVAVSNTESKTEDFSDDEMMPELLEEPTLTSQKLPTCDSILKLYIYFENVDWEKVKRAKQGLPYCFLHCTATRQNATIEALWNGWRARNFINPGYNAITHANGDWTILQDFDKIANGVAGFNRKAIHKSYFGGIDANGRATDNRTPQQILFDIHWHYLMNKHCPWIEERGHNEVANKACPSYNHKQWLKTIDLSTI